MSSALLERITIEPGKCGGRPCIRGTRMRVSDVLELLANGASTEEVLSDHPSLVRGDPRRMRFVVDNQLPPRLSKFLEEAGHDSVHVAMVGMDTADDRALWAWARREDRIVVSKDEDLLFLANRPGDKGRLMWVRLGNCRRDALVEAFVRSLPAVVAAIAEGQRVVEIA
jgi:predicted nuclease of predicted toxin-antitoxin system/uncharacterized protein (DUF433 family)